MSRSLIRVLSLHKTSNRLSACALTKHKNNPYDYLNSYGYSNTTISQIRGWIRHLLITKDIQNVTDVSGPARRDASVAIKKKHDYVANIQFVKVVNLSTFGFLLK